LADSRHAENPPRRGILTMLLSPTESVIVNAQHTPIDQPASLPDMRGSATPAPPVPEEPVRHLHRQRDYGIGYGNSSGYGSEQHYVDGHVDPIFRCV
jgi:hypothetical protein